MHETGLNDKPLSSGARLAWKMFINGWRGLTSLAASPKPLLYSDDVKPMSHYPADVEGLRAFLTDRTATLDRALVNLVFDNKSRFRMPEPIIEAPGPARKAILERKRDEVNRKNLMAKKMRAIYP